jgi:BREX system ATP-binding protein BrxC/D
MTPSAQDRKIRPRDRDAIIQSLRAGVVPRRGHQHIQVGRADEVDAVLRDLARIADGGSAIRFVIGEYGSGKTFFLFLLRAIALEQSLVTAHADLAPDRRLHATGGQARALYSELMANLATRAKPDGGAMPAVVERFVTSAMKEAQAAGQQTSEVIHSRLEEISQLPGGYDFAEVVAAYWRGYESGNDQLQSDAIRWLRGEFGTKTDARSALGVRTIVEDDNIYERLKLMARFVALSGYGGLLVAWDEMVNLYKLGSGVARRNNYEQLLRIVNDSLQGTSVGLGFLLGGTPEFLMDTRKGLFSYDALRTRLEENRFSAGGFQDLSGPVLHLASLSKEELYLLLENLRHVYAAGNESDYLVPDEALKAFMEHCSERIGDAYFRTPRNTIKAFLDLLAILDQNADASWEELVGRTKLQPEENPDLQPLEGADADEGDELTSFEL